MRLSHWGILAVSLCALSPVSFVGCGGDTQKTGTTAEFQPTDKSEAEASSKYMEEMNKKGGS